MIEIRDISKSFGNTHVLKNISTFFERGKTNLIIGQSGSGKTVLLKSIIGLHKIDEGEIFYDDKEFSKMQDKDKKEIRKELGMVFQGGALFDSSTVQENVMFPLDMFTEMSYNEKLERVNFCLNKVNLENANNLYPAEISGGMQKRVAIARAISLNPKYLFCDEPNSGLDPITAIVIDNLIRELTLEFNMTTVINTHDMNSVMEIGDKITFIHEGQKWWEGNKSEILKTENHELNSFVFASELMRNFKT
ncbi:MAG: ATP-binding cassette domain-containing protein [Bacteroidales bacterium]|nr:ATP-binding cassette domain-containing protein [Bacteroidales bacterium]MBN2756179.1 ATP-binding cassette domain-containing protein [Bacteroidales bacterium]